MAQVITFFSKQAIMGATGVAPSLYSEVFDVQDIVQLAVQFRVHMTTDEGIQATGALEHCMDQRLTPTSVWRQVGTNMAISGNPPPTFAYQVVSNLGRFIRAKITAAVITNFVVSLDGVARSTA